MVLPVTEDTPPDMLAGSMDLRVVLPDGHTVKMSVERSTPMMDLLVQATTLNKMTPAGHVLQAMGEHGVLPYKPSTPIGALEAWTIHIIPKNKAHAPSVQKKAPLKPANQQQPFEQTFRLQVHLPRNQLYVMRVSSRTLLCDILQQTCSEKNLDSNKYEMRHPADLSQLLNPSCSLADYGLQEVTVVARSRGLGQALSSSDIMALQREEDKRRQQVRQQQSSTGLSLVFNKRSRSSVCEGSVSSDSLGGRSISPARSDESASRSASPPAPVMAPPMRPARKRRPAPKPPVPPDGQAQKQSVQEEAVNVSHSRNSSDSSGYHEASVLSDGPVDMQHIPDTLPRRNKMAAKSQGGLSRSMSSLNAATSTTSLSSASGQKKKKAPPPPPVNKTTSLERHLSGKSNNQIMDKCSTLPGKMKMSQPDHETSSTMIPESSNHVEEKQASIVPKLLEEKTKITSSSTHKVENHTPIEAPLAASQTVPVEVSAVSEPASLDSAPVISELAPVETGPAASDLAPVEALPAPVEFASPSATTQATPPLPKPRTRTAPQPSPRIKPVPAPPPQHKATEYGRFGVGRTMVMLSQSGDSQSSGSWEWRTATDTDDLEINDLCMFDANPDSQDDADSLFDSEHETSEASSTSRWHKSRGGSLRMPMATNHALADRGSFASLQSTDDRSAFAKPRRWKNSEQLATTGWVLGDDSESEEAIDQVEEAFSCVTSELEEDVNVLPPPPTTTEDAVDDWQYQLPAPPTAFRDSSSPTLTEGETVDLASAQVFAESEIDLNRSVTRKNPLFIAQECDMDVDFVQQTNESKSRDTSKNSQEHVRQSNETKSRNREQLYENKHSREYGVDLIFQNNEFKSRDRNYLYDDSGESDTTIKQRNNETKSRDIKNLHDAGSRKYDVDFRHQINEQKSRESKHLYDDMNSRDYTPEIKQTFKDCDVNIGQFKNGTKSRDSSLLYDIDSREYAADLGQKNKRTRSREPSSSESESRSIRQQATSARNNELSNFTITSYQKPHVTEDIYSESTDDEKANFITKPKKLYMHQKFSSMTTLNNSDGNLSRTNSFSDEASKQPTTVKRSTSHISLALQPSSTQISNKTKSVSNLADEEKKDRATVMKEDDRERLLELQEQFIQLQQQLLQNSSLLEMQNSTADAPLQSLQVLRSILPQLGQQQVRSSVDSKNSEQTQHSKNSEDRQAKFREDKENSERLQDRQNSKSLEVKQNSESLEDKQTNESGKQTSVVTVNNERPTEPKRYVYRGPPAVNFTTWSERPKTQVSIKMDGDYRIGIGQSNQKETRNKTVEVEKSNCNEVDAPPQVVSQVTVCKPAVNVSETKEFTSSATVGLQASQHSDLSRVPIVRSVELKKSFIEQQNLHKSTTLLNGDSSNGSLAADQRSEDDKKFVGVNSLAKKFSAGLSSANTVRPMPTYGRVDNTAPRKYTSVVGIGADSDAPTPAVKKTPAVVRVNGFTAPKHLMPVVKGFQFAAPAANRETTGNKLQRTDSTSAGSNLQRVDSTSAGSKLQRTDSTYAGSKLQRTDSTSAGSNLRRVDSTSAGSKLQRTDSKSAGSKLQQTDSTSFVRSRNTDQSERLPPPQITPSFKKTVTRPKTMPTANPRDQLMDAIRNFGGRENLRQHSPTEDNVVVIR